MSFLKVISFFSFYAVLAMVIGFSVPEEYGAEAVFLTIISGVPVILAEPHVTYYFRKKRAEVFMRIKKGFAEVFSYDPTFKTEFIANNFMIRKNMIEKSEEGYTLKGCDFIGMHDKIIIQNAPSLYYGDKYSNFLPTSNISFDMAIGWYHDTNTQLINVLVYEEKIKVSVFGKNDAVVCFDLDAEPKVLDYFNKYLSTKKSSTPYNTKSL